MADPAQNIIQSVKDINPVGAVKDAVSGVIEKVGLSGGTYNNTPNARRPEMYFNEPASADEPAVLMTKPSAQAQFVNQHQESNAQALLRDYYQKHPEFAAADPIRAKRLGVEPQQPQQQQKTPQQSEAEREQVEGPAPEIEPATGLIGEGAAKIGEAAGMTPQHAATMGGVVNTAVGILGLLRGSPFFKGYRFTETPEQLVMAAENMKNGAGEAAAAPRSVTPETMYTTGTEAPGKPVGPGAEEISGLPAPEPAETVGPQMTGEEIKSDTLPTAQHFEKLQENPAVGEAAKQTAAKMEPAIKDLDTGEVYDSAKNHGEVYDKMPDEVKDHELDSGGFLDKGEYVSRKEALNRIAAAQDQGAQPRAESVGAAALNPQRSMEEDLSVAHTMPDLIARAHETPLTKEQFGGFKVSPDSETGHPVLTEPVNMVDALRISHYAGQRVGELQDIAKTSEAAQQAGTLTPEMTKAFTDKVAEIRDQVLPVWSGMRHQIGLALKVLGKPTSELRATLLNARDLLSDVDYSQPGQLMQKLANLDVDGQTKLLAKINQKGFWDHLSTLWQAQKLGPNTALKKWTSDALMSVYQPIERYAGAAYSQTLGSGEITFSQANAYLRGAIGSIQDAMRIGRASERADKPLFDAQMGFGEAAHRALGSAGTKLEGTWLGHAYDLYANLIHELGGRRILYPDQTAKYIHYSAQNAANAMEAAEREVGATGTAAQKQAAFEHFLANPTKEMQENAYDYARAQTFSSAMQQLKFVQEFRKTPAGKIMLPFFPTPVNILSRGVQGVGLGPLTAQWRGMYAAGGAQRDLAMARNGLGFLMAGALVHHWMAGRIVGELSPNPDIRKLQTAQGLQPYSVLLGNYGIDLGNLPEPIGDMLGLVANTADTAQQLPVDFNDPNNSILHQRLDNIGNALTMALVGQLHNASFFRMLSDVVHFIGDDKSPPADRIKYLRGIAGGISPTVLTDLAHWWDPIHREIRSNLDQLRSEVPGVSSGIPALGIPALPPDVDLFGRDAIYPLGSAGLTLDLLSSPKITGVEHDRVTDELLRLQPTIPPVPKSIMGPQRGPMSPDSPKYGTPLTPEEQHQFKVLRGTLTDADGNNLHDALGEMMMGKAYKDANDNVRHAMVDEVLTQYQGMAKEHMIEGSPGLQQRIQQRQEQRAVMMGAQ